MRSTPIRTYASAGAIRFSAPKKGFEMACLPSFAAAMAMTCAEVTTPWPPRPDIRMLIRRLIMVDLLMAPSELRLRQRFLGRRLLRLLLLSQIGEERLRLVRDVLLIGKALAGFLGIAHFLETFHAVLPDLEKPGERSEEHTSELQSRSDLV